LVQAKQTSLEDALSAAQQNRAEAQRSAARLSQVRLTPSKLNVWSNAARMHMYFTNLVPTGVMELSTCDWQVESETKQLVVRLERQKTASAAKMQQLASVVQELQGL